MEVPKRSVVQSQFLQLDEWQTKKRIDRVLAGLAARGVDKELLDAIFADRRVLSGSLILQLLLGETWMDSDIDVFSPIAPGTAMKQLMFDRDVPDTSYDGYRLEYEVPGLLKSGGFYATKGIQILNVQNTTVVDFVDNTFDLDFLKNTLTGRGLTVMMKRSVARRESPFHVAIVSHGHESNTWFHGHHGKRILKYIERGFRVRDAAVLEQMAGPFSATYPPVSVRTVILHDRKLLCTVNECQATAQPGHAIDDTTHLRDLIETMKMEGNGKVAERMYARFLPGLPRGGYKVDLEL